MTYRPLSSKEKLKKIKKTILDNIGKSVEVTYCPTKKKTSIDMCVIEEVSKYNFTVRNKASGLLKSYSYIDVYIGEVLISCIKNKVGE